MMPAETADIGNALKTVLRQLVRPVVVVTARHEGRAYAMAATAVSEVSMEPPSMLVCINRNNAIFAAIDAGCELALNVLSQDHEAVSRACGGAVKGEGRFEVGQWDVATADQPPALTDALAVIHLEQASTVDHGTHRVIIGNVKHVRRSASDFPLAYFDGRYLQLPAA